MAEESNELDLETIDQEIEKKNKVEQRIKDLSEKVRLTSEERDAEKKLAQEQASRIAALEKEQSFFNSFSDSLAKYPKASAYKDEIKEKVLKGYSVEDATIAALAAKGEFAPARPVQVENPAGGAATVHQPITGGEKKVSEMTREEKRAALLEAEKRGEMSVY